MARALILRLIPFLILLALPALGADKHYGPAPIQDPNLFGNTAIEKDLHVGGSVTVRDGTSLDNLGGTGALNAAGFFVGDTHYGITCDGVTDNTLVMQLAATPGRDIYLPKAPQPCIFGDLILNAGQGLIGYGSAVQAPPGARYIASAQSQTTISGLSVFGGGETLLTTVASASAAGSSTVIANAEATASAATASGTTLTFGGTIAGLFTRNMMVCDGASSALCATYQGYIVGTTLHVTSLSQGVIAIGQELQTFSGVPITTIAAQLITQGPDISTWQLSKTQGTIASIGSPQAMFSAMTISGVSSTTATLSGNATVSGPISGTRFEAGERTTVQMSPDGYRVAAWLLGMVQDATHVTLTLARPLPEATASGGQIYSSWGSLNVGCGAASASLKDIVWNNGTFSGAVIACPDVVDTQTQAELHNLSARQGLRNFFVVTGQRAGPVISDVLRMNEAWAAIYSLTGNGTAGPYTLREPVSGRLGGGFIASLISGGITYTSVQSWQVVGATNYYIDPNTYQIVFGSVIPNGQAINITEANLVGNEGIIVDAAYGSLSGAANAFHLTGHGGGCQTCYGVYNPVGTPPIAGGFYNIYGDPANDVMVKLDGPQTTNLETGRLSNATRATVKIINGATVSGNINVNPKPAFGNPFGALELPFVLDPGSRFFGSLRNSTFPSVDSYSKVLQTYAGSAPPPLTSGTCVVASDVAVGTQDIPCTPDATLTGYLVNNALTITSGGSGLAVGMDFNGRNLGVPQTNVLIGAIAGSSVTLVGCAACGSIGSAGSPVTFTASTLLSGQMYTGSTVHTAVNTPYLPAWATVAVYDGAYLHLSDRVTGDTILGGVTVAGIPAGTVLAFSGPVQPAGAFGPTSGDLTVPTAPLLSGSGSALHAVAAGAGLSNDSDTLNVNAIMNTANALLTTSKLFTSADNNQTFTFDCNNRSLTAAFEAAGNYPANFQVFLVPSCQYTGPLTARALRIVAAGWGGSGFGNGADLAWPGQGARVYIQNGAWQVDKPNRWRSPPASQIVGPTLSPSAASWSGATITGGYVIGDQLMAPSVSGTIAVGQAVSGTGLSASTVITGMGYGTTGGVGAYFIYPNPATPTAVETITTGGITLTVDTTYFHSSDNVDTAGFSPSGYNQIGGFATVLDTTHLMLPVLANPGTATVLGTATNEGGFLEFRSDALNGIDASIGVASTALSCTSNIVTATVNTTGMHTGDHASVLGAAPSGYDAPSATITKVSGSSLTYPVAACPGTATVQPRITVGPNDGLAAGVGGAHTSAVDTLTALAQRRVDTEFNGGATFMRVTCANGTIDQKVVHNSSLGSVGAAGGRSFVLDGDGCAVNASNIANGSAESHLGGSFLQLQNVIIDNQTGQPCIDAEYQGHIQIGFGVTVRDCTGAALLAGFGPSEIHANFPIKVDGSYAIPFIGTGFTDSSSVLHITAAQQGAVQPLAQVYDLAGNFTGITINGGAYYTNSTTGSGGIGTYALSGTAASIGGAGESLMIVPVSRTGGQVFNGQGVVGTIAGTTLTIASGKVFYGATPITLTNTPRLLGAGIGAGTFVTACSGTGVGPFTCTLNRAPGDIASAQFFTLGAGGARQLIQASNNGVFFTQAPNAAFDFLNDFTAVDGSGGVGSLFYGTMGGKIYLSAFPMSGGSGCVQAVSAAAWSAGVVTLTVPSSACFTTGDIISAFGIFPTSFNLPGAPVTVVNGTTITYPLALSPTPSAASTNCGAGKVVCQVANLSRGGAIIDGRVGEGHSGSHINVGGTATVGRFNPTFDSNSSFSGDNTLSSINTWSAQQNFTSGVVFSGMGNALTVNTGVARIANGTNNSYGTVASLLSGFTCSSGAGTYGYQTAVNDALLPVLGDIVTSGYGGGTTRVSVMCGVDNNWRFVGQFGALVKSDTWANRPTLPTLGQLYTATDLGPAGCLLQYNGTIWKPASGSCTLYLRNAVSTPTSANTETNVDQLIVPAGLATKSSVFDVCVTPVATGAANTKTISVRVIGGTSTTITGLQILSATSVAGSLSGEFCRKLYMDATSGQFAAAGGGNGAAFAGATIGVNAIDPASAWNFSLNGSTVNAADTIAYRGATIMWRN